MLEQNLELFTATVLDKQTYN